MNQNGCLLDERHQLWCLVICEMIGLQFMSLEKNNIDDAKEKQETTHQNVPKANSVK
jgi:hypothetical protein